MRLNKYIAASGVCARRVAAELVKDGKVKVNGKTVVEPFLLVLEADLVEVNGKTVRPSENLVYILLNKPKNYLCTSADERGRHSVLELIREPGVERLFTVGRLDRNTTGLLLLTNDGEMAQRLAHPRNRVSKIYTVELNKPVSERDMQRIADGVMLEDGRAEVDALAWPDPTNRKEVILELHSGKNRIVRRIFESLGYEIYRLDRTGYAGLTKKDLPRGRYRHLADREVIMLRHFTGRVRNLDEMPDSGAPDRGGDRRQNGPDQRPDRPGKDTRGARPAESARPGKDRPMAADRKRAEPYQAGPSAAERPSPAYKEGHAKPGRTTQVAPPKKQAPSAPPKQTAPMKESKPLEKAVKAVKPAQEAAPPTTKTAKPTPVETPVPGPKPQKAKVTGKAVTAKPEAEVKVTKAKTAAPKAEQTAAEPKPVKATTTKKTVTAKPETEVKVAKTKAKPAVEAPVTESKPKATKKTAAPKAEQTAAEPKPAKATTTKAKVTEKPGPEVKATKAKTTVKGKADKPGN